MIFVTCPDPPLIFADDHINTTVETIGASVALIYGHFYALRGNLK